MLTGVNGMAAVSGMVIGSFRYSVVAGQPPWQQSQ
jgi:hypothetical protein